jgi:hypothetical protein
MCYTVERGEMYVKKEKELCFKYRGKVTETVLKRFESRIKEKLALKLQTCRSQIYDPRNLFVAYFKKPPPQDKISIKTRHAALVLVQGYYDTIKKNILLGKQNKCECLCFCTY